MSNELKKLGKMIEQDRQNQIRRIEEDQATAEHDLHMEEGDVDPYCRECRTD